MAVVYDSGYIYVQSVTDICDKVTRIDAIITALEDTALKSAFNDDITEYMLDDGQTKIQAEYRGTAEVIKSIHKMIQLRNMYQNQLNGRHAKLVDSKSLRT
jgi:uncharacterized protein Yka (UPF0111/DUF47 family)